MLMELKRSVKPLVAYHKTSNTSHSQIKTGSPIQAVGFRSLVLKEAGSLIQAGSEVSNTSRVSGHALVPPGDTLYDAVSDVIIA